MAMTLAEEAEAKWGFGPKPNTVDEFVAGYAIHHTIATRHIPDYTLSRALSCYIMWHFEDVMVELIRLGKDPYRKNNPQARIDAVVYLVDRGCITW